MNAETKTIKVSGKTYEWLVGLAGGMQAEEGRRVSIDEALYAMKSKKLSDLAGKWEMDEKEAKTVIKNIRKGWEKWNPRFA